MMRRTHLLAVCVALGATALVATALGAAAPLRPVDRRVVDTVDVGDPVSESMHGYAGYDDAPHHINGTPARSARGWMRYALTTFDDTEVTIACTFVGTASGEYDLVVEDSLIATKHHHALTGAPTTVEIAVPFAVTKGKATVAVMLRGRNGSTPALHQLRTIQDHNEVSLPLGVAR
jgi:hypothetical protein